MKYFQSRNEELMSIFEQTGYKMDELLEMSSSEYYSILFAIIGKNQKIKEAHEKAIREAKNKG